MHPILFKLGSLDVHTFGVVLVIAFFASIALARGRASRYGVDREALTDVAFWTILAGVFGARALFIAQEWGYFTSHPRELFSLKFEGLTSFGGLFAGAGMAVFMARKRGIPVWKILDLFAPAFLLAHAIGRIGCLFNGCCTGQACDPALWYAVRGADDGLFHFPAQAVDSAMNFGALFLILGLEKRQLRPLAVTGLVLVLHGLARFVYEFFRAGASSTIMFRAAGIGFTEAHVVALLVSLAGLGLLGWAHARLGQVRAA